VSSPEPGPAPVLEGRDVTVAFGGLVALEAVSVAVPPAGIVGLIGPNGAGKTTLFSVLSGLLRPRSGRVVIDGIDATRTSPPARARRGLARTFQRLELFDELTVREHLVVARRVRARQSRFWSDVLGLGRRAPEGEDAAVDELLGALGLEAVADRPASSLPLGTGRLVEVARAVASDPRVLLLDEPSSGLDAAETSQLAAALRTVVDEERVAMLLVEHDVAMVLGLSSHVAVLDFGVRIAYGTPDEIRNDPAVRAAYLGEQDVAERTDAHEANP
jgi:branched-chain amino acid transport system ATP-binding protein